jgi:hypothetical protein
MLCKNQRRGVVDWGHTDVPKSQELDRVAAGAYLRLQSTDGSFFWCEVLGRSGKSLKIRSLDRFGDGTLNIGDEFITSTGAVFRVF